MRELGILAMYRGRRRELRLCWQLVLRVLRVLRTEVEDECTLVKELLRDNVVPRDPRSVTKDDIRLGGAGDRRPPVRGV